MQAEGPLPGDEVEALVIGEGVVAVEEVWMCVVVLVAEGVPGVEVLREIVVDEQEGDGPDEDEGDENDSDDRTPLVSAGRLDLLLVTYCSSLWFYEGRADVRSLLFGGVV